MAQKRRDNGLSPGSKKNQVRRRQSCPRHTAAGARPTYSSSGSPLRWPATPTSVARRVTTKMAITAAGNRAPKT